MSFVASGHQQMSLQIDASDVDNEILREREDALQQLEVRASVLMCFSAYAELSVP